MAAVLEQAGRSVIHMGIGEPDFPAAQPVLDAAAKAIAGGTMRYTPAIGLPALREAISTHYRDRFGLEVGAERIVITAGASGALLLACAALVGRDDEVLMPDPSYPCNRHFVTAFEGKPRLIPSGPAQRFQLSASVVREHWRSSTRGVLLASPSNPTGTSIATNELRDIVHFVREQGGFTLVDEIYQGLSYDSPPFSALSLGEDVVVINSFSKYFICALAGRGCGGHQQFFQILQHDRLAVGLARGTAIDDGSGREAGAEFFHLRLHAGAASRTGLLHAGSDRHFRTTQNRISAAS